jgi:hypothetical protein
MKHIAVLLATGGLIIALGIAGQQDYEHEQREAVLYCEMVAEGTWGAYRTDIDCEELHNE